MDITWHGKTIDEMSREDLVSAVRHLYSVHFRVSSAELEAARDENERLKKENEKLWACLGAKS